MKEVKIYPFTENGDVERVKGTKPFIIADKLNNGVKLTDSEKEYLTRSVNDNSYFKDSVPLMGVRFNFSDFLKTFVVKQHGSWHEYKAYNKSTLRAFIYGRIEKIIEIE